MTFIIDTQHILSYVNTFLYFDILI